MTYNIRYNIGQISLSLHDKIVCELSMIGVITLELFVLGKQ